jgi:hypothetical protein
MGRFYLPLVVVIVCLIAGVFLMSQAVQQAMLWNDLEEQGLVRPASLRGVEESSSLGRALYTLTFDYVMPDGIATGEQRISQSLYDEIGSKREVLVLVHRDDFETVRIVGSKPNLPVLFIYPACAFLAAIVAWLIYEYQLAMLRRSQASAEPSSLNT